MATHLKRQAGVVDASYAKGTIEVRSDAERGFDIAPLLRLVKDELGLNPLKRIEATIRGRVVPTSSGSALQVVGTKELLLLQDASPADAEQTFRGVIEVAANGALTFRAKAVR